MEKDGKGDNTLTKCHLVCLYICWASEVCFSTHSDVTEDEDTATKAGRLVMIDSSIDSPMRHGNTQVMVATYQSINNRDPNQSLIKRDHIEVPFVMLA